MPFRAYDNGQDDVGRESVAPGYLPKVGDVMFDDPPTDAQIAAAFPAIIAAREAKRAARESRAADLTTAFNAVPAIERLRNATPAQIDAFIDANVTNLAGAIVVLKALAKAVAYLARGNES